MLSDDIANDLMDQILTNKIKVGSKLKSERILAEEYGVSRTVVREALKTLSYRAFLRILPGKGAYVRQPGSEIITDNLEMLRSVENYSLAELVEVREELEVDIIRLAVERASDQQLAELERMYHDISRECTDANSFMRLDKLFHHYMYGLADNSVLQILSASLYDSVDNLWFLPRLMYPERIKEAQKEHLAIIEALKARDATRSEAAMRYHFGILHREIEKMESVLL